MDFALHKHATYFSSDFCSCTSDVVCGVLFDCCRRFFAWFVSEVVEALVQLGVFIRFLMLFCLHIVFDARVYSVNVSVVPVHVYTVSGKKEPIVF